MALTDTDPAFFREMVEKLYAEVRNMIGDAGYFINSPKLPKEKRAYLDGQLVAWKRVVRLMEMYGLVKEE